MGLLKAAASAISGSFADQWLDCIKAENMSDTTVMCQGTQMQPRKGKLFGGSNTKGSQNVISNGSKIQVYPNQMMLLIEGGRIIDYCAEEGYYEVFTSQSPSLFNGELGASLKDTWERFKFGGIPSTSQQAIFINLQEIKGIKFGTRNPINYFDNFYNAELFIRCHGVYSIKITDPIKFFVECCPRNSSKVEINQINEQYLSEFLTALQASISQMSVDGVRISNVTSKAMELSKYMSEILDKDWKEDRGFEIKSVGISSISYDDESKELINMRNRGAMLGDPTIREGYIQGSVAEGMRNAGSNSAGAMQGYMGMGMGMNAAGGFMQAASSSNQAAAQAQAAQQAAAAQARAAAAPPQNSWTCSCGHSNTGKFCMECGKPKPAPAGTWTCSCGNVNTGKFCMECGQPKPAPSGSWTCSCGQVNTGKFCANCGKKQNEQSPQPPSPSAPPTPPSSAASGSWTCSCGKVNTGMFCMNCGSFKK
jgi:membrane protease subunit (stomatin/prohibitin family)